MPSLAWLIFNCLKPEVVFSSLLHSPISLASTSELFPFMHGHRGFLCSGAEPCH